MSDLDSADIQTDGCTTSGPDTLVSRFRHLKMDSDRADSGLGSSLKSQDEEDLKRTFERLDSVPELSSTSQSQTKINDVADEGFYSQSITEKEAASFRLSVPVQEQPYDSSEFSFCAFNQDEDGDTNLHMAIIQLTWEVAFHIIHLAPSASYLNLANNLLQTPLHLAVLTKQAQVVRRLMTAGAQVDMRDMNGNTPLHIACREGFTDIVKILLQPVYYEETKDNSYEIPYQLIPQDLEAKNYEGLTCLHLAAQDCHTEVLDLLLDHRANVNAQDGKSGRTVLHYAAEMGNLPLLTYLLKHPQINVDCKTYGGMTPLSLAYGRGHSEIISLLQKYGADVTVIQEDEESDDEMNEDMPYDDLCISGRPVWNTC